MVVYSHAFLRDAQPSQPIVRSFTTIAGQTEYAISRGITHSEALYGFRLRISDTLTGASTFKLSLYRQHPAVDNQLGIKVLDNLFDAPQALPTDLNDAKFYSLKANEFLPMQIIIGKTAGEDVAEFNLSLVLDSATTAVGKSLFVFMETMILIGGHYAGGKTNPNDILTPASN